MILSVVQKVHKFLYQNYNLNYADEDIDGQSFLELDDVELRTLGQKIGVIKKLHRLKQLVSIELISMKIV